ncbi:holdfast anchoring protein HfaB [Hyphobacterium sp.]|jgi:curli biogenesis system outer membrane secretion channel CsgG|uniref:holdfast anchoring protein HfaB n=1 Tax=Hyphobacterium sp. TaxID=2004662 RepID=UPI003BAB0921
MAIKRVAIASLGALLLAGCAVTPNSGFDGRYANPIGNAPVTPNPTPYTDALVCLASTARAQGRPSPRIAVGRISDYTGAGNPEGGGPAITQGASLMAMSAFAKAGINLVERFDTSIAEYDLRFANNRLIGDNAEEDGFRQIYAGSVPGVDYAVVGGVTELNFNIRSQGLDFLGGDRIDSDPTGVFNGRLYVMNVAIDLRMYDAETLEIVDVISYQKQIIGREVSAGVFSFWGDAVIDISTGGRSLEPIQLAVRSLIERAVLEFSSTLYGVEARQVCAFDDPLGLTNDAGGINPHTSYAARTGASNVQIRQSVDRGHQRRDPAVRNGLRGRYD